MDQSKDIRVVALDVYGTILPTKGEPAKRKGLENFIIKLKNKGIILCTCSDAKTDDVLEDFKKADLEKNLFDYCFEMKRKGKNFTQEPKNFNPILEHYNISPEKLTVIGDRYVRDIEPSLKIGCNALLVPEYTNKDENNFDLSKLEII